MIDFKNFPTFSEEHFHNWINELTPIQEYEGYSIKRDDFFNLGGVTGGKVRQCSKLVYDNLDYIKEECNGGILTAAGLPSPQSCIVSAVAKYFGLKCIVTVPIYPSHLRDYNRINVSLAQKLGAEVYGVGNPNTAGPEKDAKELVKETGYFQVKFGMNGKDVMRTVSNQVENISDNVHTIVGIAGSGLSMLGVMVGIKKFNKPVKKVIAVSLSNYINRNKEEWYDTLPIEEKFEGELQVVKSPRPYQYKLNLDTAVKFDMTYESKAWEWMTNNLEPDTNILFWDVGIKEYDLSYIEDINWNKSEYEKILDKGREIKKQSINHSFF